MNVEPKVHFCCCRRANHPATCAVHAGISGRGAGSGARRPLPRFLSFNLVLVVGRYGVSGEQVIVVEIHSCCPSHSYNTLDVGAWHCAPVHSRIFLKVRSIRISSPAGALIHIAFILPLPSTSRLGPPKYPKTSSPTYHTTRCSVAASRDVLFRRISRPLTIPMLSSSSLTRVR